MNLSGSTQAPPRQVRGGRGRRRSGGRTAAGRARIVRPTQLNPTPTFILLKNDLSFFEQHREEEQRVQLQDRPARQDGQGDLLRGEPVESGMQQRR